MSLEDAQLPYLSTFVIAAELGSFTAAAAELRLSQAAVSQRVHALEQSLGTALFQRRGGRVLLTEAGRRLHAYARQILDLHHQARSEITGIELPVTGQLDLAANATADVAHIWTELTCRLSSDQRLLENGADRIG